MFMLSGKWDRHYVITKLRKLKDGHCYAMARSNDGSKGRKITDSLLVPDVEVKGDGGGGEEKLMRC